MNASTNSGSASSFDIDSMLDGVLDDLADAPEFKPFPAGTHKVTITIVQKKIGTHPAFEVNLKAIETLELSNSEDTPLKAGATSSCAYMMDIEIGQGNFKKILASLAAHYGPQSNRQLIEAAQNAEVLVVTKVRMSKDKTQSYTDIVELSVI
jgi:hypothetical protein